MKKSYKFLLMSIILISSLAKAQLPEGYCSVEPDNNGNTNNCIVEVNINDEVINKSFNQAYSNFTENHDLIYTAVPGTTFSLKVTEGDKYSANDVMVAFLDFDRSGSFEDAEKITFTRRPDPVDTEIMAGGEIEIEPGWVFDAVVAVPLNASTGLTLLRIVNQSDDQTQLPCKIYQYGETEDYAINIEAAGLVVDFTINASIVGLNEDVTFTNTSNGENINSYAWNFGEGATPGTSTLEGPVTVQYSTEGVKTITLSVTDDTETKAKTKTIEVKDLSTPSNVEPQSVQANPYYNTINVSWLSPTESYFDDEQGFESSTVTPQGWEIRKSTALDGTLEIIASNQTRWELSTHPDDYYGGGGAAIIKNNRPEYNWLIAPSKFVLADQELSYRMKFRNTSEYPAEFIVMIKAEAGWVELDRKLESDSGVTSYQEYKIDLSDYVYQFVQVAFVHHQIERNTSGMRTKVSLDNISIKDKEGVTNSFTLPEPTSYVVSLDGDEFGTYGADVRNCTIENLAPATYSVEVKAMYDAEASAVVTNNATTINPEVTLNVSDFQIGIDEEVEISANIKGSATSFSWEMGDNATFTGVNTEKVTGTYQTLGEKTVKVTVNGTIVKEFENALEVVNGSALVQRIKPVTTTNELNNVTVKWPSALNGYRFYQDFETLPFASEGWSLKKSDAINGELRDTQADEGNWYLGDKDSWNGKANSIKSGDYSATISYGSKDCSWLISPQVTTETDDVIRFYTWYSNNVGENWITKFYVLIKEVGSDTWHEILAFDENTPFHDMTSEVEVSLAAYPNKTVNVAFVHEWNDGIEMCLDDIRLMRKTPAVTSDDFTQYNVYRNDELVASVTDPATSEYLDENLRTGYYAYQVSLVNSAGLESQLDKKAYRSVYQPELLQYSEDFEGEYYWRFRGGATDFAGGTKADFDNATYSFPANDGAFVAVNLSESEQANPYDIVGFPTLDFDKYAEVTVKFDYIADGVDRFILKGRATSNDTYERLHVLEPATDWTTFEMTLPASVMTANYQLAIMYSDGDDGANGVAFDNIQVFATTGKDLDVVYDNQSLSAGETCFLGQVRLDNSYEYPVVLRNNGTEDLTIQDIQLSGDNFTLKTDGVDNVLASKEETIVYVTYAPTEETGTPEQAQLTIAHDASNEPLVLDLSAECGQAKWTYMVYLYEDGQNLNGRRDINEWEVNGSVEGDINYLVYYDSDNDHKDGMYYIQRDEDGMNDVIISPLIQADFMKDIDMNEYHTLQEFILYCKAKYPAENFGCNVWDHGTGIFREEKDLDWKNAVGEMPLWDLTKAVKAFKETDGQGFTIFGFDLCLLGQVETVYELKDYADIVIASEMNEPGNGWDYTTQFTDLNTNPQLDPKQLATNIVDKFTEVYVAGGSDPWNTTQAAIDTKVFKESFIPALNNFADQAIIECQTSNSPFRNAYNDALYHNAGNCREHRDLGGFLQSLIGQTGISNELFNVADELLAAYNSSIIKFGKNNYDSPEATGLKIWFANDITNNGNADYYLQADQFLKFSETKWDEFLYYYGNPQPLGPLAPAFTTSGSLEGPKGLIVNFFDESTGHPYVRSTEWSIAPATYELVNNTGLNDQYVSVRFLEAGEYSVTLTVDNGYGEVDVQEENHVSVRDYYFGAPVDVALTDHSGSVTLNWKEPATGTLTEEDLITGKLNQPFEQEWVPNGWATMRSDDLAGNLVELSSKLSHRHYWFHCMPHSFGNKKYNNVNKGNYAAAIYWEAGNELGMPKYNWLTTPEVAIGANEQLRFALYYFSEADYPTILRVMVKVNGAWEEAFILDGGDVENKYAEEISVSLGDYAGETVQIAFVYEYSNGYNTAIDDVRIVKSNQNACSDGVLVGYEIYEGTQKLGETTDLSYTIDGGNSNTVYAVKAIYENTNGESVLVSSGDTPTGIDDQVNKAVRLAPNPSRGLTKLYAEDYIGKKYIIYSSTGSQVQVGVIDQAVTEVRLESKGLYLLKIEDDLNSAIVKIVVE